MRSERICTRCGRSFQPSSKHRLCPACRNLVSKKPCPHCGRLIQARTKQCVCLPPRPQPRGRLSPNWKGDNLRRKAPNGYVWTRAEGHPRGVRNAGFVLEHIVVMEGQLGRYLLPGENVHHRNGVKSDNRPENLELWARPQPPGCRVEDLVAWARSILARYAASEAGGGDFT